jgi:hypothetical protein
MVDPEMVFEKGDGIYGISLVDENHVFTIALSFGAR